MRPTVRFLSDDLAASDVDQPYCRYSAEALIRSERIDPLFARLLVPF